MNPGRPQLLLFDIDGTLIETGGAGKRALERAFADAFEIGDFEQRTAAVEYAGRTDPGILAALAQALGVPRDRFEAERETLLANYFDGLRTLLREDHPSKRTLPGVVPLLEALAPRPGAHLGLLTGNMEQSARIKLDAFDLNRFFPEGGFSSDHADRREIARAARQKLEQHLGQRFAPADVVVIGDTEHDVDCARANSFRAVAVSTGWVPRERLEAAQPDVLLDGFEDLPAVMTALLPGSTAP
ncbi:hypothetical protein ABI59_19605 [Acidobacteria bacterium Mor1]|nr:hypothetical protein ABI59_19605 [Acidobacteria bacterium Mor1]